MAWHQRSSASRASQQQQSLLTSCSWLRAAASSAAVAACTHTAAELPAAPCAAMALICCRCRRWDFAARTPGGLAARKRRDRASRMETRAPTGCALLMDQGMLRLANAGIKKPLGAHPKQCQPGAFRLELLSRCRACGASSEFPVDDPPDFSHRMSSDAAPFLQASPARCLAGLCTSLESQPRLPTLMGGPPAAAPSRSSQCCCRCAAAAAAPAAAATAPRPSTSSAASIHKITSDPQLNLPLIDWRKLLPGKKPQGARNASGSCGAGNTAGSNKEGRSTGSGGGCKEGSGGMGELPVTDRDIIQRCQREYEEAAAHGGQEALDACFRWGGVGWGDALCEARQ